MHADIVYVVISLVRVYGKSVT